MVWEGRSPKDDLLHRPYLIKKDVKRGGGGGGGHDVSPFLLLFITGAIFIRLEI